MNVMDLVALTVADLERSVTYYERLGLGVLSRSEDGAVLGAGGRELLALQEIPGAAPAAGHTGLFHFALLLPEREDLAAWLAHARDSGLALTGASDHFVSEALYLRDPDHHGIEIYWDRPRDQWEGQVADRMGSWPLDLEDLLRAGPAEGRPKLPDGTVMGHVHLRVSDIPQTVAFYREVLGFELMARLGDQAAFFATAGYHHHIGANTWESRGAGPAPEKTATLRHAVVRFPDTDARDAVLARAGVTAGDTVTDPSGNRLKLIAAS